jgi:hypothetical protein
MKHSKQQQNPSINLQTSDTQTTITTKSINKSANIKHSNNNNNKTHQQICNHERLKITTTRKPINKFANMKHSK